MSAAKDRRRLGKDKNINPVKKFGERTHTHIPPPNYVNTTGGRRDGGVAGNPGIPAIRRDGGGGSESHHTQKESEVKREESERKMGTVGAGVNLE